MTDTHDTAEDGVPLGLADGGTAGAEDGAFEGPLDDVDAGEVEGVGDDTVDVGEGSDTLVETVAGPPQPASRPATAARPKSAICNLCIP